MRVAIVGYGVEGESNFAYWSKLTDDITIVDEKINPNKILPSGAKTILGEDALNKLYGYDLVVRTAGLPPRKIKTDGKIWSSTNEFFSQCRAPIIGVTGTKGKGTTSSLIASIMEETGKKVWLVGNIGVPPLGKLDDIKETDVVVFEMSSFQLWDIEFAPHIAVILPIEAEHLDVHTDFEEYREAKAGITKGQGKNDVAIYYHSDTDSRYIALKSKGKKIAYGSHSDDAVYVSGGNFYINEQKICSTEDLKLLGKHNIENACAAMTAAWYAGATKEHLAAGVAKFKGLPHRLEFVRNVRGVDYYNDTCATAPAASAAAIQSFDKPEIVIIGGKYKGGPLDAMVQALHDKKNVKKILLIGVSRDMFYEKLSEAGFKDKLIQLDYQTMPEIVDFATKHAESGDVVLLSPACASFDMFKDYYDRGNQFKDCVNSL